MTTNDPRVDAYIDGLPQWQQDICRQVRDIAHAADPDLEETIKRTRQPYFVLHGNVCALLAAKDHVNVFVYDGGIAPDPHGIITAGHANSTARTVAIRRGDPVPADALLELLRSICADNRAGGWRRIKMTGRTECAPDRPAAAPDRPPAGPGRPPATPSP